MNDERYKSILPADELQKFARRWRIDELSLFGSVLRPDFSEQSDIDVLVHFHDDAPWGLFEMADMQEELERLTGRAVDLVSKSAIERSSNALKRKEVLGSARIIYAA